MCKLEELSEEEQRKRLREDFNFKKLCQMLDKLSVERKDLFMEHLEENKPFFMSVEEFCSVTGIPNHRVRRWLREKLIKATKVGRTWLIPRSEFERLKRESLGIEPDREEEKEKELLTAEQIKKVANKLLDLKGITNKKLADLMKIKPSLFSEYKTGKKEITPEHSNKLREIIIKYGKGKDII